MLVSKMHRKGKCPSSEERDPFVSKEIFISLFLRWEPRNVERVWIRLRVKESRKISGSLFQIDRKGSFEIKILESREKVCSENEKKGISGSRMFRSRRKGSFESKT